MFIFIVVSLLFHPNDIACDAKWSFFKTTHGKGACKGVGAEVTQAVVNHSAREECYQRHCGIPCHCLENL